MEARKQNKPYRSFFSEDEWTAFWADYNSLLAAQDEAVKQFEPSQAVDAICRRFINLEHLEVRESFAPPSHLRSNQAYKNLSSEHSLTNSYELPYIDTQISLPKLSGPSVYLLGSLLRATSESQLRSLLVDPLAVGVFGGREETDDYSQMIRTSRHLRTIKLRLFLTDESEASEGIISRNRIRSFFCLAPCLEDLELTWEVILNTRTYHVNIAHILPREYTWPHLRRLRLTNAEFAVPVFLDFLSCHGPTLRTLELEDCALQDQGLRQCNWSDIFIPLVRTCSLSKLTLEGRFTLPQSSGQNQAQDEDATPLQILARDRIGDLRKPLLHVDRAMDLVICSKEFHSFLHSKEEGCRDSINRIKEGIIQDLMDFDPAERAEELQIDIPTRYVDYLRSFISRPIHHNSSPLLWWPDPEDPNRLPFSSIPWSPSWMETLPDTWSSEDVVHWY
ncbi:unnamed protein product [Clonostachys rosea]|uniref:HNH nuclease domain-containing protein n=1 Tax=Bionectria ochroleuca TaxID=29856 RepID=A0ABY6TR39_BIOOC|nr:unnamed protein product [Clonostachys rosea]